MAAQAELLVVIVVAVELNAGQVGSADVTALNCWLLAAFEYVRGFAEL